MNPNDPLLFRQLQVIQKIIQDETWLEGERRGCPVSPDDCVVRENVCRVVLRIGAEMRRATIAAMRIEAKQANEAARMCEEAPPLWRTAAA